MRAFFCGSGIPGNPDVQSRARYCCWDEGDVQGGTTQDECVPIVVDYKVHERCHKRLAGAAPTVLLGFPFFYFLSGHGGTHRHTHRSVSCLLRNVIIPGLGVVAPPSFFSSRSARALKVIILMLVVGYFLPCSPGSGKSGTNGNRARHSPGSVELRRCCLYTIFFPTCPPEKEKC